MCFLTLMCRVENVKISVFFFFSQSHTTPCCYLAVTHNGARLIFFALELCAFSFNLAANAILVEPAMFIVCLNSGSSLFDNRLRLRSTPGASMWVDGTSARSFCPDLPSCSSSPLVCLFCLFVFSPFAFNTLKMIVLFFIFGSWMPVYVGCSWTSFNMSVSRGYIGTSYIMDGSCETVEGLSSRFFIYVLRLWLVFHIWLLNLVLASVHFNFVAICNNHWT